MVALALLLVGADVELNAGRHAVLLTARGPLQRLWSGQGIPRQPIPAARFLRGKG